MPARATTTSSHETRLAVAGGTLLVALAMTVVGWRYLFRFPLEPMVDLDVYKEAGRNLLHGRSLYSESDQQLVFTYPPFAALFAVVMAPFGRWLGQFLWAVAMAVGMVYVVSVSFRAALSRAGSSARWLALGAITAVALLTHPLVENVFFGQINVLLVVLVLADLTVVSPRWPRGVLVGVATAIKLTPGVFAVHLWLTGRRRPAVTALVSFVVCTALAVAVTPSSSRDYWTHELFSTGRIGASGYTSNQSLFGMASRVLPGSAVRPVWLALAVLVAFVGFRRARTAHRCGDDLIGIAIVGLLSVLLSPIAWIHHYVWMVVAIGALAGDLRNRRRVGAASLLGAVLLLRLPWWGWAMLDGGGVIRLGGIVLHNSYGLLALVLVFVLPTHEAPASAPHVEQADVESGDRPTMPA